MAEINNFYIQNAQTGMFQEVNVISSNATSTPDAPVGSDDFNMSCSMSFTLRIPLKQLIRLYGITNNSIRMHGGKAIRTVPKIFEDYERLTEQQRDFVKGLNI